MVKWFMPWIMRGSSVAPGRPKPLSVPHGGRERQRAWGHVNGVSSDQHQRARGGTRLEAAMCLRGRLETVALDRRQLDAAIGERGPQPRRALLQRRARG